MAFLLEQVNMPGSVWGLNLILTPSDDLFALKVAGSSREAYKQFKQERVPLIAARERARNKQRLAKRQRAQAEQAQQLEERKAVRAAVQAAAQEPQEPQELAPARDKGEASRGPQAENEGEEDFFGTRLPEVWEAAEKEAPQGEASQEGASENSVEDSIEDLVGWLKAAEERRPAIRFPPRNTDNGQAW
mmetsp:Transcript_9298/g.21019  ORF Transcript_9298/g.21019 Transcript_9298/m.21019 type:complete len:189 (-) Transcript_9298:36-602(-)